MRGRTGVPSRSKAHTSQGRPPRLSTLARQNRTGMGKGRSGRKGADSRHSAPSLRPQKPERPRRLSFTRGSRHSRSGRPPRPGKWVGEHAVSPRHRPAPRLLQAGAAHRPPQPEPARLRHKGTQQKAPLPSPDPGLVQPPAVVRPRRLQMDPGPLLPQGEGPAPLHVPQLRHGPSPSLLRTFSCPVYARGRKKRGGFFLFSLDKSRERSILLFWTDHLIQRRQHSV